MARGQHVSQKYVARGDRNLAEWHRFLRTVTFVCALVLMSLSLVALHWALTLVGIPNIPAWIGGVFLEAGMAATASTATTIRKKRTEAEPDKPGGYYVSLWIIFSFLMALAQAANIGHAIVSVDKSMAELPAFIPPAVIYAFAAAFAALFPLGGTMFVHVSGFLRAHSIDAEWIDDDAQVVRVAHDAAPPAARTTRKAPAQAPAQGARTEDAQPARTAPAQPAQSAPSEPRALKDPMKAAARELFDASIVRDPLEKPDAAAIHRAIESPANVATTRRWVQKWWEEHEAEMGLRNDPIVEQVTVTEPQEERATA